MPDSERILTGQLIAERYRVGRIIGRGGMGIVYEGEHVRVGRRVAIKVLTQAWSNKPVVRQRFEAEARAASAAGHPNVIQVFDVGELPDQRLYTVMEFIAGENLYNLLWAEGPLAPARACRLIRDAAFGVRAAHAQGVIHRDLKLENVMVQALPEGEAVKVLDFGIAAGVITKKRATVAGMAMGTPESMAPEQVDGVDPTVRFDIYALGVMLFELLTKRLPIVSDNPLELMALKQHVPAPRVSELRPELPPALDQLIADCLEIDPSLRPSSCEAFLDRLTPILDKLEAGPEFRSTLELEPSEPPPRPSRLTRAYVERDGVVTPVGAVRVAGERAPSRWPAIVGVVGGLALIAAVVLLIYGQRSTPRDEPTVVMVEAPETARVSEPAPVPELEPKPEPQVEPAEAPAPAPEQAEQLEPAPAPAPDPKPDEQPSTPPTQAEDPSQTPRCAKVRARALDGRRSHDWDGVLAATRSRDCWARSSERKKLETQAYMELGRFEDCLRAGKLLTDTESNKWVTLCKKRLAG